MRPLEKEEVDRILDNNLVDEFDRLAATPGFVLVPMPFETVQTLAREGTMQSLGQLGRHPQHIRTYRDFRSKVKLSHALSAALCLALSAGLSQFGPV